MVFSLNRISLLFICKLFANIPRRQGIRLGQQLKKKKNQEECDAGEYVYVS